MLFPVQWVGCGMVPGEIRGLCSAHTGNSSVWRTQPTSALSVAGWEKHHAEGCGSCSFQAISKEQRELIMIFQEPQ